MNRKMSSLSYTNRIMTKDMSIDEIIIIIKELSMIALAKSPECFPKINDAVAFAYECVISSKINSIEDNG